jgi:hypothetical protein
MQLNAIIAPETMVSVLEPLRAYLQRVYRLVARCMPHMTAEEVAWRWECMTGMMFYSLAQPDWQQRVSPKYCNIADEALLRRRLMESALALFGRAPEPPPAKPPKPRRATKPRR